MKGLFVPNPLAAILLLVLSAGLAATGQATVFYVSPQGDDSAPGDGRTKRHPLRTLKKGLSLLEPGDTLIVRAGIYREVLAPPKSGTPGRPIVIAAEKGETVVISSLEPLKDWTPAGDGLWAAAPAADLGFGRNQIFLRGDPLLEARHPNVPEAGLAVPVRGLSPLWPTFGAMSFPDPKKTGSGSGAMLGGQASDAWKGAGYFGVHHEAWAAQSGRISGSSGTGIEVDQRTSTWWWPWVNSWNPPELGRGMVFGVPAALDQQGEWIIQEGKVVLNSRTAPAGVEQKVRMLGLDLRGRSWITVRGIRFLGGSASLADAEHCVLDSVAFHYPTHFMVFDDARNGHITKAGDPRPLVGGESALYVSGRHNRILNSTIRWSAGGGLYLDGYGHVIHNNLISECSYAGTYLAGIMMGTEEGFLGGGHTITYNTVEKSGRALFHMDGNRRMRDGGTLSYAGTLISHNRLANGMLVARDGGLINSWHTNAGAWNGVPLTMTQNVFQDCWDTSMNLGILYVDNGSSNFNIRDNLITASPGTVQVGGFFNPPAFTSTYRDNIFYREFTGRVHELPAEAFPRGVKFAAGHNFVVKPSPPSWPPVKEAPVALPSRSDVSSTSPLRLGQAPFVPDTLVLDCRLDSPGLNESSQPFEGVRHRLAFDPVVLAAEQNNGLSPGSDLKWTFIRTLKEGSWVLYQGVNLAEGFRTIEVSYASVTPKPKTLEVREGGPEGPLLAVVALSFGESRDVSPGGWGDLNPYAVTRASFPATAKGFKDLCFVVRGEEQNLSIHMVRFLKSSEPLPLPPDMAVLEIRSGSPTGPIVGAHYPRDTKGRFRLAAVGLEDAPASALLYAVLRSSRAGVILKVESAWWQKGEAGYQWEPRLPKKSD